MDFPVEDWEAIPIDTYKSLLAEVKERFEVINEETVSITDKSIKCLLGYITYVFGVGVFLLTNHYEMNWFCYLILILVSAYSTHKGYKVIRQRSSHSKGLLPENVLSKDFNENTGFSEDDKQKLFYYNAIKTYSVKITEGTKDMEERAGKYDTFFGLTLLLVLLITVFVFYTISYHPVSVKS